MEFKKDLNRIYYENEEGKVLAEVTYPEVRDGVYNINHTMVDDSLGGKGVAGKLVAAAVEDIKSRDGQVIASCSFASQWLEKHIG